jgi:hypothetical protein
MKWVPAANNPAADLGGTPNQKGGIEGYWEADLCARIGRGWQQASPDVYCTRVFTLPFEGTVRVSGRAVKEWYHKDKGSEIGVCILHNDQNVWPENGWATVKRCDLHGVHHDIFLDVKKGDILRFVVDKSKGGDEDLLPWLERVNILGWIPRIVKKLHINDSSVDITKGSETNDKAYQLRINCGSKTPVKDHEGNEWDADSYFKQGNDEVFDLEGEAAFSGTDEKLLMKGRIGAEITYDIPMPAGLYTVRLSFADYACCWNDERRIQIEINGNIVESDFDIAAVERLIKKKRIDRIYNCIAAGPENKIHIHLRATKGEAIIQAIEIASERREKVRINCGADEPFVDWAGFVWEADRFFKGGALLKGEGDISQATPTLYDKGLYLTSRSGRHIEYRIPVIPGIYCVHLKFAELWNVDKGARAVDISLNDRLVKKSWDASSAAERLRMAIDLRFEGISPVEGRIKINIDSNGDNPAVIQAIELE